MVWYIGMGGYSKILINQAEYASMGHLISKKYANVIILEWIILKCHHFIVLRKKVQLNHYQYFI